MHTGIYINSVSITSEGQITIPKDICAILGVTNGDYVTFVVENGSVRIVNSIYAMKTFQQNMVGQAEQSGLITDNDVVALVHEIRNEG